MSNNKHKRTKFIKIKEKDGYSFLTHLKHHFTGFEIIDHEKKIVNKNGFIFFPLIENKGFIKNLTKSINILIEFEIISMEYEINRRYKYKTLQDALRNKISEVFINYIPKSYDIIGDIAIVEFDKELLIDFDFENLKLFKSRVADALKQVNKNVAIVYEKHSEIKGKFRLRELTLLSGKNRTETLHKENNCLFKLDLKKTFFTPRLVFERKRVSKSNINEDEIIVDMFAGVGPFSIQLARIINVKIYSFDINPSAIEYLKENIEINRLQGEIHPYNLDIRDILEPSNNLRHILKHQVDRIIMNLPESSLQYVDVACFLMKKSGGILHNYQFSEKPNSVGKAIINLKNQLKKENWTIKKILTSKIVKAYSPKSDLIALDLVINSL